MAKKAQLAVGQEWVYAPSPSKPFGWANKKVTIVGAVSGLANNEVKVSYETKQWGGSTFTKTETVPIARLTMPWSEYGAAKAAWQAQQDELNAQVMKERAEYQKWVSTVQAPAIREFLAAVQTVTGVELSAYQRVSEIDPATLAVITAKLKEAA